LGVRILPGLPVRKRGRRGKEPRKGEEVGKLIQFLKEVKVELLKVTWPKRDELVGSTAVVLALSILLAGYLWAVDTLISKVVLFFLTD
jgi:preprotein translocase subunit SecE